MVALSADPSKACRHPERLPSSYNYSLLIDALSYKMLRHVGTVGDACGMGDHQRWMKNALRRPHLCASCSLITTDINCFRQTTSEQGYQAQVMFRELYHNAESALCRICSIFLCVTLHGLHHEMFSWSIIKFLEIYGSAITTLKFRTVLRSPGARTSECDIHELLLSGQVTGTEISTRSGRDSHLRFKVYAYPGGLFFLFPVFVDSGWR